MVALFELFPVYLQPGRPT